MSQVTFNKELTENNSKHVAHFLLLSHLELSPPNDAMTQAYRELGYDVDMYSPDNTGDYAHLNQVAYGYRWLLRNIFSSRWRKYDAFSCTSEDPVVIAGFLALLWRKPLIFLSDEIKTKSYRGDRSNTWKKLCRFFMRRAVINIVNDEARIDLQKEYAGLAPSQKVMVYPGCFRHPPAPDSRDAVRTTWKIPDNDFVLGFSGGCNLTAGIDWALESLDSRSDVTLVMQPLAVDQMSRYLLANHRHADRIFIQQTFMTWQESWRSMSGVDIGVAIYTNQTAQFQKMGVSSNRLCMFLAMGVPVIVSKQPSFQFVEEYNCGVMVESTEEFTRALENILSNLQQMKENALRCARDYIDTDSRFSELKNTFEDILPHS